MKKCVFVLEDDTELRELFILMLDQEGYEVKSYPDAATFTAALRDQPFPDVAVLDVRLPDGNGVEICNSLKADPKTSDIPILIMSAHKDLLSLKINSRADDHLEKPFDINSFLDKVNRLSRQQT